MISVIIPVYNVEKYIRKCIDSVLMQTYSDYEIILVDDGSTDSSPLICDEYANINENILVIHKSNGGLSSARNAGMIEASGDFFYFLDSDDYIHPECFAKMMKMQRETNADMVVSDIQYIDENGKPLGENMTGISPFKNETLSSKEYMKKLTEDTAYFYCKSCNKIIRKSVMNGILFPEKMIHEDEATIHYIVYNCRTINCLKDKLYYYVKHNNSITGSDFSVKNLVRDKFFYERTMFLQKNMNTLSADAAYYALRSYKNTLLNSFYANIHNITIKELSEYVKQEYKLAKNLIQKESFSVKWYFRIIVFCPRLFFIYLRIRKII